LKLKYAVYEEVYPDGFYPFSLVKPSSFIIYRYKRLIEWIKEEVGEIEGFIAPEYIINAYELKKANNFDVIINSRIKPELIREALDQLKDGESLWENNTLVASKGSLKNSVKKKVNGFLFKGLWEITGSLYNPPFEKSSIEGEVNKFSVIDDSKGPVIIEKGARIEAMSVIYGPAYISAGSVISFAKVAMSYVGKYCRIGGELERSIIEDFANKAHFGFVGDSYIGSYSNLGAGTTTSNLKNTYGTIKVFNGREKVDTGKIKVGAFIGDFVRSSINTSIMSGKTIGPFSHVTGIVKSDIKPFLFYDMPMDLTKLIEQTKRYIATKNTRLKAHIEELINGAYKTFSDNKA
jgi:hypothetical protein